MPPRSHSLVLRVTGNHVSLRLGSSNPPLGAHYLHPYLECFIFMIHGLKMWLKLYNGQSFLLHNLLNMNLDTHQSLHLQ